MKIYFEGISLEIDEKYIKKSKKIKSDTAQIDFLKGNHFSDIQKECYAIKEMTKTLSKFKIKKVSDLMAGCGFSGKILEKYLESELHLNDLSPICCDILLENFPSTVVTNTDVFLIPKSFLGDLVFIDFNNFTLNKVEYWEPLLRQIKSEYLMITDSACYGFKFGNLKAYGCSTKLCYYKLLGRYFEKKGWDLHRVIIFGPAALVLFTRKKNKKPFLTETKEKLFMTQKKGLIL